jgi:hypothetical protein
VKIVTGVQALLKLCSRNLSGCNIGVSDGGFVRYAVEMDSGTY